MVDASVGGKTGVDLDALKNQIGIIIQPEMVLVSSRIFTNLPSEEVRSGFAEMLKHSLIADHSQWEPIQRAYPNFSALDIEKSVDVKDEIVTITDPFEHNERKKPNFGHTLGHAIESFYLVSPNHDKLLHGEAIAIGMIMESFISTKGL